MVPGKYLYQLLSQIGVCCSDFALKAQSHNHTSNHKLEKQTCMKLDQSGVSVGLLVRCIDNGKVA